MIVNPSRSAMFTAVKQLLFDESNAFTSHNYFIFLSQVVKCLCLRPWNVYALKMFMAVKHLQRLLEKRLLLLSGD